MCSVGRLRLSIAGHDVNTQCLVLSSMLEQFKLVIGMDIIQQLGGVTITTRCTRGVRVVFSVTRMRSNNSARINKSDFTTEKIV